MNIFIWIVLIILIATLVVIISSYIDNRTIIRRYYEIKSDKIAKDCKLIFLSDLHGNHFGTNNEKLITEIDKEQPDIILYGGDMITAKVEKVNTKDWDNAFSLMEGLKNYQGFYGVGNHEYRMDLYRENFGNSFDELVGKIESKNISFLYNSDCLIEEYGIDIKGLAIDRKYYKRFDKHVMTKEYLEGNIGKKKSDIFTLMLAHNPEYFLEYADVADLTLSGHVHGGIVKLPLLGGVISPRLTLFPKYDGGLFEHNGSRMIISRGLGSHTLPFRVFNPCELVIIKLKKNI